MTRSEDDDDNSFDEVKFEIPDLLARRRRDDDLFVQVL